MRARWLSATLAAASVAALLPSAAQARFRVWPAPEPRLGAALFGVDAGGGSNIWAVGIREVGGTLAEHWNGRSWRITPTPLRRVSVAGLHAVAVAPGGVTYAVGVGADGLHGLVLRRAAGHWRVDAQPGVSGRALLELVGVSAPSAADVIAVGWLLRPQTGNVFPYIAQRGARGWRRLSAPVAGVGDMLLGVSARGPRDVWAVGSYAQPPLYTSRAYVLRWDGRRLHRLDLPLADVALAAVDARDAAATWMVGQRGSAPFAARWDGRRLRATPIPRMRGCAFAYLNGVTVIGPRSVWAAGACALPGELGIRRTLLLHWDGLRWRRVFSPQPTPADNELNAISSPRRGAPVVAVGDDGADEAVLGDPLVVRGP